MKMGEKSETISVRECRVSFLCKICGVLFRSVSTYCTHKFEHHPSLEFLHNKSLVFEESTFEPNPNDHETGSGFDNVAADEWETIQLNYLHPVGVKEEPPAPVIFNSDDDTVQFQSTANSSVNNHINLIQLQNDNSEPAYNSDIKTEWVEDTLAVYESSSRNENPLCHRNSENNLQENEGYIVTETQSSFIRSESDADADMDLIHEQFSVGGPADPLEDFDVTQSNPSTSTLTPTEMEQEYHNENSDSNNDVICLDDSPSPPSSSANKMGPTATVTATFASNSFILSQQLKLQCLICSKQFSSSAQLGIHVSICELYNGKIKESAGGGIGSLTQPEPPAVRSRISSSRGRFKVHVKGKGKSDCFKRNNFVNCEECSIRIRRCNLNAHLRTEHEIFVEDSDRRYVCQSCGSAFHSKSHLHRHGRVHSDSRPFACSFPECYRAFKDDRNLKHHVKTHHPHLIEML